MSSVSYEIGEMSALVDQGCFVEAAQIGNAAQIRLGVDTKSVQGNDKLSHGTQSTVFRGQYLGRCVAIKKAKISKSSDLDNFKLETSIMAELRHVPNVISVLAARLLPPGYMLIMPYIPHNMSVKIHHDGWRPDWPSTLQMALALTTALSAIHAAGILHRDMKPGNILLDEANIPYICDFGIAIRTAELEEDDAGGSKQGKPSGGFHKRHMIGTLEYMAPEILQKRRPRDKSDVWALAVTLNELATGVFPYSDCTHENPAAHTVLEMGYGRQELAASIATEGLLPLMKPDTPQPFAALLEACWQLDPLQRPSAAQMLDSLKSMHTAMQPSGTPHEAVSAGERHAGFSQDHASAPENLLDNSKLQAECHHVLPVQDGSPVQMQAEQPDSDNGYRPQVTAGAFATAGLRGADRMEDTHVIQHQLGTQPDCHLLAVFDGHRGKQAAEYAAQHFPATLADKLQHQPPAEALSASFVGIDIAFRQQQQQEWRARVQRMGPEAAGKQPWPGCTALAVLIKQSQLYVACAESGHRFGRSPAEDFRWQLVDYDLH